MNILLLLGLLIIFIIISVFVYKKYTKKMLYNPNNEYINNDKKGQLMLFYAAWCPHSKTTLKQWYAYKEKYSGTSDYSVSFTEIDCDENTSLADKYNINEYPTIILLLDNKKYIYDAQMNDTTLTQFINTIMK
jgi:thioredoxin-like negative regulator of GroEL